MQLEWCTEAFKHMAEIVVYSLPALIAPNLNPRAVKKLPFQTGNMESFQQSTLVKVEIIIQ